VEAEVGRELALVNSIGAAIDKAWFTFLCPVCDLENECRVQQAALEERVHCRGCHETIQLVDRDASTMTTMRQLDSALNELQEALRKFR
jgi:transcription initiation factor IIE alpha subunit